MLTLALELAGWRAIPLGVDVPVREYQKAVSQWRPDLVCVSFILSRNVKKRFDELARIRDVPVVIGGRSLLNYQGLARRHGLCPLAGPAWEVVAVLAAELEHGCSGRGRPAMTDPARGIAQTTAATRPAPRRAGRVAV